MPDGIQEFAVAQFLQVFGAQRIQVATLGTQAIQYFVEPVGVDVNGALETFQHKNLALQFFQYIATDISTRQDGNYIKQAANGTPARPSRLLCSVIIKLRIKKFEPQECTHPLVKRLFVQHD
jgi:hypothetical protein